MDSNSKKNNGYETNGIGSQSNAYSSDESQDNEGPPENNVIWSNVFKCDVVNGVLAPVPISWAPFDSTELEDEEQSSSPAPAEPSERKRKNEGKQELFFKLFKFPNAFEQYLLEVHEMERGCIDRRHVQVYENNTTWKVAVHDLAIGDHVVEPIVEDPSQPAFKKICQLSLQERLVGWTVETRKRRSGKDDKFYYHMSRQFRSFVEVTAFVIYSSKMKDLKLITSPTETTQDDLEAEAVEAMMRISSSSRATTK